MLAQCTEQCYSLLLLTVCLCMGTMASRSVSVVYWCYNNPNVVNQLWVFDENTGIPGVFRISSKADPSLFLTSPLNPTNQDLVYTDKRIPGTGATSQQQLWRLIPSGSQASSVIENYANAGLVLDIPNGITGRAIQMFSRADNANQLFFVDVITEC